MANTPIKLQKIFADISATGPSGEYQVTQFGSLKAASPLATSDPTVIQALPAYGQGLGSAIINSGTPAIQDIDGLCKVLSTGVAYLQQAGISEYNVNDEYKIGSLVSSTDGAIYRSVAATNTGNALTDTSKWMLYKTNRFMGVTGDYTAAYNDIYITISGTNDNMSISLPAIGAHNKGRTFYIVNNNTNIVGINSTGTDTIELAGYKLLAAGKTLKVISNGVSRWDIVGLIA